VSFRNLLAIITVVALAACGGGKSESSASSAQATASPSTAANAPMGGMNASGEAMAPGTLATVPPGLNCGAVRAVWVNVKTHVYHEPSDPYYGRTKHGEYMCPSQAVKEGYHKAGARSKHSDSSDTSGNQ
jgi:hypothetical protein